jgi:hypothetical protein
MNQRERTLGLVVAALLVLVVGYFAFSTYSGWVQGLRNQISGLETTVSDKDAKITRGQFAAKRLKEFAARSLPGNPEVARSLYKAWLLELAEGQVKLASPIVTPGAITPGANGYQRLTFTVSGNGSLEQFAQFLTAFYEADYLHNIRSLRVKPDPETKLLEINLAVEALVLEGAAPASALAQRKSPRFDERSAKDYVTAILNRNIFSPANRPPTIARIAPQRVEADKSLTVKVQATDPDEGSKFSYRLAEGAPSAARISATSGDITFRSKEKGSYQVTVVASDNGLPVKTATQTFSIEVVAPRPVETAVVRPTPPRETPKPRFEDGKFAYVTAIVEVAGRRELWVTVRTSGEILKLTEGEKFEVEQLKAVVDRIGLTEIEVSSLGERRRFSIGDNLAEGSKLPAARSAGGE